MNELVLSQIVASCLSSFVAGIYFHMLIVELRKRKVKEVSDGK